MNDSGLAAFESFLVEDVILTLGNLRGSLDWLGGGAATDRACLDRLGRQLAFLEDRAHRMARMLRDAAAMPEPANLFAAPGTAQRRTADIDRTIGEMLARGREGAAAPLFRSRRA